MPDTALRRFLLLALLSALLPLQTVDAAAPREHILVGSREGVEVGLRLPLASWDAARAAIDRDEARVRACLKHAGCNDRAALPLAAFLQSIAALPRKAQVAAVQAFVDRVPYKAEAGSANDVWQPPLRFLASSGDCEDFAIAKYVALHLLGFPESSLQILVVRDVSRGLGHAVLLVETPGRSWVLDNLHSSVMTALPASYAPLYAVNRLDRWVFAAVPGATTTTAAADGTSTDDGRATGLGDHDGMIATAVWRVASGP